MLRKEKLSQSEAAKYIKNKSVAEKIELLFSHGINFNNLLNWQKRGIGLYWTKETKVGYNSKSNSSTKADRNIIQIDYELPMRDEYSNFIFKMLKNDIVKED
jgi:tRNA(His) 5'-end guanylyltransferase